MSEVSTRPRPAATRVTKSATPVAEAAAIPSTAASKTAPPAAMGTQQNMSGQVLLDLNRRFDPTSQLLEAEAAINAVEVHSPLHWAIVRLIGDAQRALIQDKEVAGRLETASECLEEVLAVIDAVEDALDDYLVWGAGTLITLAKVQIDAEIEQQTAALNGGAA